MPKAKIAINEQGQVVIRTSRPERLIHIKDLNAAIRQQLLHIAGHYKEILFLSPLLAQHSGLIEILTRDMSKLNQTANLLATVSTLSSTLRQSIEQLEQEIKKIKGRIALEKRKQMKIVEVALSRAEDLLRERQRCENIISLSLANWFIVYNQLIKGEEIKWSEFFESVQKIQTIRVNPYRERTQSSVVKFLQYNLYPLAKKDKKEAARKLWLAVKKLLPIYPYTITFRIGQKQWEIINGKIKER